MRSKITIAVGLALGLLFLGQAWTGAEPAKEVAAPLPEGLRQAPPDGMGFVYVRLDKFFESKLGQALKKDLLRAEEANEAIKKLESQLGLAIKDLESVTLVSLEPIPQGPRDFRQMDMKMEIMLRLKMKAITPRPKRTALRIT